MSTTRRITTALLAASLLVAACGDDDDVSADATTTSETTSTTASDGTTSTTEAGELPGERVDIFPYEGAELAVVGVEADDILNVRSGPGTDFDVLVELEPLAAGFAATGHNRQFDTGMWVEVEVDDRTGWANVAYLAQLGRTDDITTDVAPADRPSAETMVDLGRLVGEDRLGDDAVPSAGVVVVDGPTVGDLGEITVDVIGFADDAVLGERLHIFAEPDSGGESFTLRTVDATVLCRRGVTEDGLCL